MGKEEYNYQFKVKDLLSDDEIVRIFHDPDFAKKPFYRVAKKLGYTETYRTKRLNPYI